MFKSNNKIKFCARERRLPPSRSRGDWLGRRGTWQPIRQGASFAELSKNVTLHLTLHTHTHTHIDNSNDSNV